ncbi:porin [Falsirhodobacter halotolerans]|uniref:porin n=1 Tax=Falsirhodobacter halotolerans TaxID=1146892 RepID=UPI001FD012F1|nr:porin [Falsirhodobacter halotolerans]MCJ8140603.1 porin [Falsirhodobacter halotolerans]
MKKLLLATSILAATTGYAAAEVALTGDARMGVVYDGEDVQFSERARVRFNLSGQTDTGLEFGATFRADQASGSASGGSFGTDTAKRGTVWVSGAFGKLSMGDVNSAAEEAFGDLNAIGFSGLGDLADIPYINGDGAGTLDQGPGALYSYTVGGFEFHVGMTDGSRQFGLTPLETGENDLDGNAITVEDDRDATYSMAVGYSGDNYKLGLGYLNNGSYEGNASAFGGGNYGGEQFIVVGETDVAGVGVKAYYTQYSNVLTGFSGVLNGQETDGDVEADYTLGLSGSYQFGATTVNGFYRRDRMKQENIFGDDKLNTFGIGANYDLGGGASLRAGVVDTDLIYDAAGKGQTVADVGIRLNF